MFAEFPNIRKIAHTREGALVTKYTVPNDSFRFADYRQENRLKRALKERFDK